MNVRFSIFGYVTLSVFIIILFSYFIYERNFHRLHGIEYWINESESRISSRRLRSGIALSRFDDPRVVIPIAKLMCDENGGVEYQTREVIGFLSPNYKNRIKNELGTIRSESDNISDKCINGSLSELIGIIQNKNTMD